MSLAVNGVPFPLEWDVQPVDSASDDKGLRIEAGPLTDMFVDPAGSDPVVNAPRLLGEADGNFSLVAKVEVDFAAAYDAGVLLVYAGPADWAKVCFEYSPQQDPMVVSVVTNGVSDDANAYVVPAPSVWLRVSRNGPAYAFHASSDGAAWTFVRHFTLTTAEPVRVGFEAQSPTGQRCSARFSNIRFTPDAPADLRDGS